MRKRKIGKVDLRINSNVPAVPEQMEKLAMTIRQPATPVITAPELIHRDEGARREVNFFNCRHFAGVN